MYKYNCLTDGRPRSLRSKPREKMSNPMMGWPAEMDEIRELDAIIRQRFTFERNGRVLIS